MDNTINTIARIISTAESFKQAYFFSSPSNANMRRKYEKENTINTIEWKEGKHTYTASFNVRCSCKHVYAHGYYTKDGKTTTLTAIRNSYKRLIS